MAAVLPLIAQAEPAETFPVTMTVDAGKRIGELAPIWRYFGADEPNYATAPDGAKLLMELGSLRPGEVYFRAHNLMTTGVVDGITRPSIGDHATPPIPGPDTEVQVSRETTTTTTVTPPVEQPVATPAPAPVAAPVTEPAPAPVLAPKADRN